MAELNLNNDNIPRVAMNHENRIQPGYGKIFRLREDRDLENEWFLGFIMNVYRAENGHVYYLVDWWYNFRLPTREHELYYGPTAIRDDDPIVNDPTFQELIVEYHARRALQPRGLLREPEELHKDRMSSLDGHNAHPWGDGVPGFAEYQEYMHNIHN